MPTSSRESVTGDAHILLSHYVSRDTIIMIIGLLCADDTRISYYLTEEQNNIVQKKGKYIDVEHQIFMIKTITRNLGDAVSEINGNLCYQKFVEIFMHEYEGNPTFETVAEWAKNNGYVSAFPSLLLN